MSRILVFSPYARIKFTTNYEMTIARACQTRGAEIKYVLCDGMLAECDMRLFTRTSVGRPFDICTSCQAEAKANLESAELSYDWLSKYVTPEEQREVFQWAQGLSPEEFPGARFRGHPLGEWIVSSIASYFRVAEIDMEDWETVTVSRGFLQAAAVTCIGLERLLEEWRPDSLLILNGRWSVLRVAFNLARQRGVRVLVYERGNSPGAISVVENETCISAVPFEKFWSAWSNVPLSKNELDSVVTWIANRRFQNSSADIHFASAPEGSAKFRAKLGLSPTRKLIALYSSSTDEYGGETDGAYPFPSQEVWIEKVIDWASRRTDCDLVIRTHPCLSGKGVGYRSTKMIEWFQSLKSRLPVNVKLIMPDEVLSSYDLMVAADLGLSYGSTAGIEMMALGKPIVLGSRLPPYRAVSEVLQLESETELESVLDHAITLKPDRKYRRAAFRYIYRFFVHMQVPFGLVSMDSAWESSLKFTTSEELAPGADEGLDRICAFLLAGSSIYRGPDAGVPAALSEEEDALHTKLDSNPEWFQLKQPSIVDLPTRIKGAVIRFARPSYRILKRIANPMVRRFKRLDERMEVS